VINGEQQPWHESFWTNEEKGTAYDGASQNPLPLA
jgi:hypothetical protein